MKRLILTLVFALTCSTAYAQQTIFESDYGYIGAESNELTVGSKVDDPAKVRLTQPITENGGGGGVISFNLHKFLGKAFGGQQTEMAMIRVEQASDVRGSFNPKGEFNFLLNDGSGDGDAAMTKPLAFTAHNITRLDTGIARDLAARISPFLAAGGSAPNGVVFSPSSSYMLAMQDDGNLVVYAFVGNQWVAKWSIFTGPLW